MKKLLALLSSIALVGCAQNGNSPYWCCLGQNVVGNKNYVTITNVWNEMDALPLAETHCNKFDRSAIFNKMEGTRAVFDCVQ